MSTQIQPINPDVYDVNAEPEFDPTPPVSSQEDYDELYGESEKISKEDCCPECGSDKVRATDFIDNHTIIHEFECLECDATWDTR